MAIEDEANKFGKEYFSVNLSSATFKSPKFKEEFGLIEKLLPPRVGDRILDIGCGKGLLGFFLLDKEKNIDLVFSDVSPESEKYLDGFNFVRCSMVSTPFVNNHFDKIFCFHVISHLPEAKRALQEILRIAKVGGKLMIVTPNIFLVLTYKLASFFHLIPKFKFDETARWLYGKRTLSKLLKDSGWLPEKIETFGCYPSKFLRFNFLKRRLLAIAVKPNLSEIAKEKKVKVALMSYTMDKRKAKGTALYARKLIANILADDRFEFYLVHYEKVNDPLYEQAKEIIMPKVKLPYGSHFVSQLLFFWRYRKNKFDIIHWFQPHAYPFFWLAPAKKIVITTHGAGNITASGPFVFSRAVSNFVLTKFVRKVDAIIAVSKYGCEEIAKYYRAPRENIFFTYNGGSEDFKVILKATAREIIFKKYGVGQPFILQLARHLPHKNVTGLISAYKIFRDKYSISHKLVIVGSRDFDTEKIFRLADKSGYKSDIIFIDYIEADDLNSLYSAAELLVFPSLVEGFGLPVIEAMASGTPVITSNTTSLPEVAGEAAILTNPLNSKEIAEAINKVLIDKELRDDLIEKGLRRSRDFNWAETAKKTKEIYFDIL